MKKIYIILIFIVAATVLKAQSLADTTDPLFGHHSIGSSSEIFLQYTPKNSNLNRVIYDFENNQIVEKSRDLSYPNGGGNWRAMDVVTGDFTGDYVDDVVSAWQSAGSWSTYPLTLSIPQIDSASLLWLSQTDTIIAPTCDGQVRLISGNFDYDDPKEFIVAFDDFSDTYIVQFILYELDSTYRLHELDRIAIDNSNVWDICADDFDGDGLDEFLFLSPNKINFYSNDSCVVTSKVVWYDYNPESGFELKSTNTIQTNNRAVLDLFINESHVPATFSNGSTFINCVGIASGNFDDDIGKEIAFGYEISIPAFFGTAAIKNYRVSYFDVPDNSLSAPIQTPVALWISENSISKSVYGEDNGMYGYNMDVKAIDLDQDSKDEVITFCNGQVYGLKLDIREWFFYEQAISKYNYCFSHNLLCVGDLDANPTDMSSLTPEIAIFSIHEGEGALTVYRLRVDTITHKIYEVPDATKRIMTGLKAENLYNAALALGDFNRDGIYLGKPKLLVKKSVLIPTLIINAPPSHFDIRGGTKFDVNFFYSPWSPSSPKPNTSTIYEETTKHSVTCTSELIRDWKVSSEFKTGFKFIGVKYAAELNASYGKKLSMKKTTTKTISISRTAVADRDDFIFGMKVDYHLFEYPIMHKGKSYGNILFSTPVLKKEIGDFSKNLGYETYSLKHEVNNLLSYPFCNQINDNTDALVGASNGMIFSEDYGLSDVLNPNRWKLNVSTLKSSDVTETNEFNLGMKVSASNWGCSIGLEGKYGNEGITSHETSLENEFSMTAIFDRIDKGLGEVEYSLQPYVYWSENGAMVIDYNVNLTGNFWNTYYGKKPDLAFIMPYRYSPEKNQTLQHDSKRILTSDIKYFPYDAKPGDSITIMATVRNFSLNQPVDSASLKFYLGDPDDNGELIKSTTVKNIVSRGSSIVKFNWKTPGEIPDKPWIFAVIDGDSLIKEIHKNNNKGFTFLFVNNKFPKSTVQVGTEDLKDDIDIMVVPNPARDYLILSFYNTNNIPVDLIIYNLLGQKIEHKRFQYKSSDRQSEMINLTSFKPGMYLYEITSGKSRTTGKLLVE
jgi:hypothetical protein